MFAATPSLIGLNPPKRVRKPLSRLYGEVLQLSGRCAATSTTACQAILGLPVTAPSLFVVEKPVAFKIADLYGWSEAPLGEAAVLIELARDTGVFYATKRCEPLPTLLPCVSWPEAYVQAMNELAPGPELAAALLAKQLAMLQRDAAGGDQVMADDDEPE